MDQLLSAELTVDSTAAFFDSLIANSDDDQGRLGQVRRQAVGENPRGDWAEVQAWIDTVEADGIREMRKRPGFRDEPLRSARSGQRSVRLNIAWRAIYVEHGDAGIELISGSPTTYLWYGSPRRIVSAR